MDQGARQDQQPVFGLADIQEDQAQGDNTDNDEEQPLGFGLFDPPLTLNQLRQQQPQEDTQNDDATTQPQQPEAPNRRDRHRCPDCNILLKLYNGRRMCPCIRSGPTDLSINRTNLSLIMVDNVTGDEIGEVAYARGLTNHPMIEVPVVADIARVCDEAAIYMDPTDSSASSCDDAFGLDADNESSSCHGFSNTDSGGPPSPQPGPSGTATTFQDLLQASRQAALRLRQPETAPGHPTLEAHHAPPDTPAASPQHRDDSDDDFSPYRTRSGTIRVPPPPTKKRKPRTE